MNEFDKAFRKSISEASVLKLVPREPITVTLPRPIATNLQLSAEWSNWNSHALISALTGFVTGAAATRSVQGGAVSAFGKGIASTGSYLIENREDIYDRVRRAATEGKVEIRVPFSDVLSAIDRGKLVDLAFEIADKKIKAWSPADNIQEVDGGLLLGSSHRRDNYER